MKLTVVQGVIGGAIVGALGGLAVVLLGKVSKQMAGLSMKMGAWGGGGSNTGSQNSAPAPSTISAAAFGSQYTSAKKSGGLLSAIFPNDAFGVAHSSGLVATGLLIWMWWTLPR